MSACYDFRGHLDALVEGGRGGGVQLTASESTAQGPPVSLRPAEEGSGGQVGDRRATLGRQSLWRAAKVTAGKKIAYPTSDGQCADPSRK